MRPRSTLGPLFPAVVVERRKCPTCGYTMRGKRCGPCKGGSPEPGSKAYSRWTRGVLRQVRRLLDREGLYHLAQIEQGWAWAMYGTPPEDARVAQALAHHPRVWVSPEAFMALVEREAREVYPPDRREAAGRIAVGPARVAPKLRIAEPAEDVEEPHPEAGPIERRTRSLDVL